MTSTWWPMTSGGGFPSTSGMSNPGLFVHENDAREHLPVQGRPGSALTAGTTT